MLKQANSTNPIQTKGLNKEFLIIMSTQLVKICSLDKVKPGKMQRFSVNHNAILVANVDGTIFAVDDMCTHEDASLYRGALKGDCVECPLHGSHFDLKTGQPKGEPATIPIKTYPVTIKDNSVFIELQAI